MVVSMKYWFQEAYIKEGLRNVMEVTSLMWMLMKVNTTRESDKEKKSVQPFVAHKRKLLPFSTLSLEYQI